jgi:hypothetical protein
VRPDFTLRYHHHASATDGLHLAAANLRLPRTGICQLATHSQQEQERQTSESFHIFQGRRMT